MRRPTVWLTTRSNRRCHNKEGVFVASAKAAESVRDMKRTSTGTSHWLAAAYLAGRSKFACEVMSQRPPWRMKVARYGAGVPLYRLPLMVYSAVAM